MKKRTFLAMSMAAALTVGCSSDDITDNGGGVNKDGKAYVGLSITLPTVTDNGSRAAGDPPQHENGKPEEYKVNTLDIYYYKSESGALTLVNNYHYEGNKLNWTTPPEGNTVTTKAVLPVEKINHVGALKALVVVNAPSTDKINNYLDKQAFELTAADITGVKKNNFLMTNTVYKDGHVLVDVTTSTTEDEARSKAATHTVFVERAAAKVGLDVASTGWTDGVYQIAEGKTNAGAKIKIEGWQLDITNKKMYPVRQFAGTAAGGFSVDDYARFYHSSHDFRTYWAEDPNYSDYIESDDTKKENFNFLVTNSKFSNGLGGVEYCLENTFNVQHQKQDETTRALIKATYTPVGFNTATENEGTVTPAETWYTLGNSSTPLHKKDVEDRIAKAANFALNITEDPQKYTAELVEANILAGKSKIIGKMYTIKDASNNDVTDVTTLQTILKRVQSDLGELTTYKNGVCFYAVRIRHNNDYDTPWGENVGNGFENYLSGADGMSKKYLGRYGVVRNNWYKVTVNNVTQPGDPVVSHTSNQDDEHYNYIQTTINILDWAVRDQGVDL